MDHFLTSLSKRQSMLLLTAVTFGSHDSLEAFAYLEEDEAELLRHRAQELLQIPREKRIPLLVQEMKRLVKDRRGQLWTADPERLAALLREERIALVEVLLRALPSALAAAVRAHLPPFEVKLTREVRPQVLDIVRWKLESLLARTGSAKAGFKFSDILLLQPRELITVCERLGARVLGPAMAGLPDAERESLLAALPPDLRQLAQRAVAANAPRKLDEATSRAQLSQHDGLSHLSAAIRSAGAQRLARACVAQSAEFAQRLVERRRGALGQLIAKWVKEELAKRSTRGDGGRTDIVADLERLAAKGLVERPIRLQPAKPPLPLPLLVLGPPPEARSGGGAAPGEPKVDRRRVERSEGLPDFEGEALAPRPGSPEGGGRRDPIAERAAWRAGAAGPSRARVDGAEEPSRERGGSADVRRSEAEAARREHGGRVGGDRRSTQDGPSSSGGSHGSPRERPGLPREDRHARPLSRGRDEGPGRSGAGERYSHGAGPRGRPGDAPRPGSREKERSRHSASGERPPSGASGDGRGPRSGEGPRPTGPGRGADREQPLPLDGIARQPVLSELPRRRTGNGLAPPAFPPEPERPPRRQAASPPPSERPGVPEGSRIFASPQRPAGRGGGSTRPPGAEGERAPRVLQPTSRRGEGTSLQRSPRPAGRRGPGGKGGPEGGSR